jgi:hypothetical protein
MSVAAQQLVRTRKLADRPQNAILLRADIHSLFDDYQWSIWVCQIHLILIFFNTLGRVNPANHQQLLGLKSRVLQFWIHMTP